MVHCKGAKVFKVDIRKRFKKGREESIQEYNEFHNRKATSIDPLFRES